MSDVDADTGDWESSPGWDEPATAGEPSESYNDTDPNLPSRATASSSVTVEPFEDTDTIFTVSLPSTTITTTVTASSTAVASWISSVLSSHASHLNNLVVGLDCEWRPSFNASHNFPVAVLQIAVDRRCLIFQLKYADSVPSELLDFLTDARFTFVGVGIEEDVEKLLVDRDILVKNTVDLRSLAAEKMGKKLMKQMGLAELGKQVIDVEIKKPKKVTMSRWDQEMLTLDQIGYASVDAYLSFAIGKKLLVG